MKIANSNVNAATGATVTVFARLNDGTFHCETMLASQVGSPRCFAESAEEIVVNVAPGARQMRNLIAALEAGTLTLQKLDSIGGLRGGYSTL